MQPGTPGEFTRILTALSREGADRHGAVDELFPVVYDELHRVAAGMMRRERPEHTLQPTALVNETYLRLAAGAPIDWEGRAHFLGIAASAMRRILVEHARGRGAAKRGGHWDRVSLDTGIEAPVVSDADIVDLENALARLGEMDADMLRIVELRILAGMQVGEIARLLGVTERTVYKNWRVARMWLARELSGKAPWTPNDSGA